MDSERPSSEAGAPRLGLFDAISLIVGIIIGAGIFRTPADIFQRVPGPWTGLVVWVLGGLLALVGAFCFAELASTYPRSGGEYVYLTRAFGPFAGYLFAWAQLTVIRPGGIAAVAYVFADYAAKFSGLDSLGILLLATGSILVLTLINVLGVTLGSVTQNLLTGAKVLGLLALVVVGLGWGEYQNVPLEPAPESGGWFVEVMILVLWTYAGWHEAAYVAAEVKDRRRNLPRALLLGTAGVTLIYLLVNAAYLLGLGFAGARSRTLAADLLGSAWPGQGERVMAVLVCVSALGAVNGMIFTTARIYAEFGVDHRVFAPLSRWSRRWGTPVRALVVQGVICLAMTVVVWQWGNGDDTFDEMVYLTAAVFWGFFLLTGIALFVLRRLDRDVPRPFRVPAYPYLPLLFCGWCACMMFGAIWKRPGESLAGLLILCAGLPFYFFPQRLRRRRKNSSVGKASSEKGTPLAGW
jgi:basic amino acid/polyamine antiporter, APA family